MNFSIPKFYRILLIDDEIAKNEDLRGYFHNLFASLIFKVRTDLQIHTEIIIEGDPVKGLKKWQAGIFDLTLIDSNFSRQLDKDENVDKAEDIFLVSNHQGFSILSLMHHMVSEEANRYFHRRDMCRFYLYSGLHDGDGCTVNIVKNLFNQFSLPENEYFISKLPEWKNEDNKYGINLIGDAVKSGVERVIKDNFTWLQKIERFTFAMERNYYKCADAIWGGCLIYDQEEKFTFAQCLADDQNSYSGKQITKNGKKGKIRILPGRIPAHLLLSADDSAQFLPLLSGKKLGVRVLDFIEVIKKHPEEKKQIAAVDRLRKRYKLAVSHKPPRYLSPEEQVEFEPASWTDNFLGYPFRNHYFAAATPLTGISVIGEEQAIKALEEKTLALLNGPAGAVVLKTVYLDEADQWENVYWPAIQVQSHMRSRCLRPKKQVNVLWNTGRTALEMLPPQSLNRLLNKLKKRLNGQTHLVIVSLGSKFFNAEKKNPPVNTFWEEKYSQAQFAIWDSLFSSVFSSDNQGLKKDDFPLVEINVRHFLREVVKAYLEGDEYLSPVDLAEEVKLQTDNFWNDFKIWLNVVHEVAVKYNKKLIMKLPYRSDTIAFVQSILSLRKAHKANASDDNKNYGVRALTLVNALKNPVPMGPSAKLKKYRSKWYAHPYAWDDAGDKIFKYQMSGAYIASYRNQILAGLMQEQSLKELADADMEILISGGVTDEDVCTYFREWKEHINKVSKGSKQIIAGIQVGTYGLLNTDLSRKITASGSQPRNWEIAK